MKTRHFKFGSTAALAGLFCCACAPFSSDSSLEQRVQQQDMQLRQMQPQQADTWNQVQEMRQEIERLRGQLDDLQNAGGARAIVDKVNQHEQALRQVDDNMALNLNLGEPIRQPSPQGNLGAAPQPALREPVPQSQEVTLKPIAPGTYAIQTPVVQQSAAQTQQGTYGLPPDAPAAQASGSAYQQAEAPSGEKWGQADPRPEAPAVQKDISLALFDAGVNSYNARQYAEAQRSFSDFLKNYKNHAKTSDAQYYLAECYFQRNEFPNAALEFEKIIKQYPKSSRAAGAYLKQGICFGKMGQPDAAKARMQELIKKFPNSPEAARARSYLKTNK